MSEQQVSKLIIKQQRCIRTNLNLSNNLPKMTKLEYHEWMELKTKVCATTGHSFLSSENAYELKILKIFRKFEKKSIRKEISEIGIPELYNTSSKYLFDVTNDLEDNRIE